MSGHVLVDIFGEVEDTVHYGNVIGMTKYAC